MYYESKVESLISNYFNQKKDYFISSEGLSGMGYGSFNNGALIKVIANRIKNIFPNAKIIIIIRNQKAALESLYKDDVKYGYLNDFKSWFIGKRNNCGLDYFKYSKMIEVYQEIFGNDNVKVLLFEKLFNLDYLNKRAVFVYLRELSGLNAKQLSVAMSNLRKYYRDITNNDLFMFFAE